MSAVATFQGAVFVTETALRTAALVAALVVETVAPTSSVWSATDAVANSMTLSNGGLTVTPSGAVSWQVIRGSISKTSGKLYIEFSNSVTTAAASQGVEFGLASSSISVSTYLGNSNYSSGELLTYGSPPNVYSSTGFSGIVFSALIKNPIIAGDVLMLAVDFTAGMYWVGLNNVWADGSPSAGTGPTQNFVPATVGALFPAMAFENPSMGVWTLKSTAASQTYTPPSGFSAWDGAGAPTVSTNRGAALMIGA